MTGDYKVTTKMDRCPHCGGLIGVATEEVPLPLLTVDRSTKGNARKDARLFLLARADEALRSHPEYSRRQADEVYSAGYNAGTVVKPDWVAAAVKSLSRPTLERWRTIRETGKVFLLAGRHSLRPTSSTIETLVQGEVAVFMERIMRRDPAITAPQLRQEAMKRFTGQVDSFPSVRSVQRFMSLRKTSK